VHVRVYEVFAAGKKTCDPPTAETAPDQNPSVLEASQEAAFCTAQVSVVEAPTLIESGLTVSVVMTGSGTGCAVIVKIRTTGTPATAPLYGV
jgi:hypothetical protein